MLNTIVGLRTTRLPNSSIFRWRCWTSAVPLSATWAYV